MGEVVARLIAAGGGHVIITYARGEVDASAVAEQINQWGGDCETMGYDVLKARD